MNNKKSFRISDRIKSIDYALQGIKLFFKTQHNAWIQGVSTAVVIVLGLVLKVNTEEWCFLIVAIALVLIAEMLNTAIEFLTDLTSPNIHPQAKKVKDIAAGAVLIAAISAVIIGSIIFLPKII